MTLDECREAIGRRVIYSGSAKTDYGVITSVNERWVFVRYGADQNSKATAAAQLVLDA